MSSAPALSSEPNPVLIFETLNAYQRSAALKGAIELGLFTAIAHGSLTPPAIAHACGGTERGTRILCDFLVVQGFLTKTGDEYGLTPTAELFLVKDSPRYMGDVARFMNSQDLLDAFRDAAGLVRKGGTLLEHSGTTDVEYDGWVEFARSMVPLMMPAALFMAEIAARRKPGPIRVLDIAAGHGMFGIQIALKNPQAHITALDWPNVLQVASANAQAAGIADRHALWPGDALQIDYGAGYDLVLLTNFLHHFDRPTCESVLRKVRGALQPEGLVMILEFVPNEDRVSPTMPATFAFTMLGTTPAGDAYTFAEYQQLGRAAGLRQFEMLDVPQTAQRLIVSSV